MEVSDCITVLNYGRNIAEGAARGSVARPGGAGGDLGAEA